MEKKCKKAKWLSEEDLQIAEKRREIKGKGEKDIHLNAEFQGIAKRDKKAFLSEQRKEIQENNRMGKTTERLHFYFSLSCIGEGNGNPLQCSCLDNPRDRGAWWLPSMGSHRVGHD